MNWEMLGHEPAVRLLSEHIAQGRVRHAYLLTGPAGVGRRTLALHFVQALNCPNPPAPGQPCLTCPTCRRIFQMQHPDLAVLQADQVGGTLKIDQIREMQRSLSLAPYEARYRVAILLRFEEASEGAANAMLKTLEEPLPQVILLLTAESAENLQPTIVSRCEVVRLGSLPLETVSQGLQTRFGIPAEEARLLAHLSNGRPGYALRLQEQPEIKEQRKKLLEDLGWLFSASRVERFDYAEKVTKDRDLTRQILQVWLSYWRDVFLYAAGSSAPLTNLDREAEIKRLASYLELTAARQAVSAIENTLSLLEKNANVRLALEVLCLDLPFFTQEQANFICGNVSRQPE